MVWRMDMTADEIEQRAYRAGLSIRKLVKAAGVAQSTFIRWRAGAKPHPVTVHKLVKALEEAER